MIHTYCRYAKTTGLARALSSYQSSGLTKHYVFEEFENIPDLDKCDIAIFGNVLPVELDKVNHPYKCYLFCSPFSQADLSSHEFPSAEIKILYDLIYLKEQGRIQEVLSTDFNLSIIHKFIYVPGFCNISNYQQYVDMHNENRFGYGFLGNNLRKHRNAHAQLVAMSLLKDKEPCIVNVDHDSYGLINQFYKLPIHVVQLDDEAYFEAISQHTFNFQVTYSESFNYMAMEYALVGVPTLCSPSINWYPFKELIINDVTNPYHIADIASKIKENGYWNISKKLHAQAKKINEERKEVACEAIQHLAKRVNGKSLTINAQ